MQDKYETLVRWYLRFNGFLTVENFVVHEARNGHIPEGAEFDTLAVRFPYSREQVSQKPIKNDPRLADAEGDRDKLIDFVIAEVKGGKRNTLNRIWHPADETQKGERIAYVLRWLGALATDEEIGAVAIQLQKQLRARHDKYLFRLVYFSHAQSKQAVPSAVPQITFRHIADFIVNLRTPCWQQFGMGARSQHEQWDDLIRQIWHIGDPENPASSEDKVEAILKLINS
jgi:hypothetical protein